MSRRPLRAVCLAVLVGIGAAVLHAAPVPVETADVIKDRKGFIPHRQYKPIPAKAVGLVVSDVAAKMGHEGRSGPANAVGFSTGGNSYHWIYVPVQDNPQIPGLQVRLGEKGDKVRVYPRLNLASLKDTKIDVPYALVEVEVNDGDGAPPDEGFVATRITRLDGTRDYPLDVTKVVAELRKKYATWQAAEGKKLETAFEESAAKALGNKKPTGPRETSELAYFTWLPDSKRLRAHFRTAVTDGDYKYSGGGVEIDPPPLPVPPLKEGLSAAFPPPPPRELPRVRYGTQFGIEYGVAYEVSAEGKVVRTLVMPAEAFKNELPPPPAIGPGRRPIDPLPPDRLPRP